MLNNLIRWLVLLLCFLGSFGYGKTLLLYLDYMTTNAPLVFLTFVGGIVAYLVYWIAVGQRKPRFYSILEHELTHLIFATLFLRTVHRLTVSRGAGGNVDVEGEENFIVALSPYFFPLFTVLIILIKPSVFGQYQWIINILLGISYGFHIVHMFNEFNTEQPDLLKNGLLFSVTLIFFFNLFFTGLCVASLEGSWAEIFDYLVMGLKNSVVWFAAGGRLA